MIFKVIIALVLCFWVAGCRPASPPEASSPQEPDVVGADQELRVDPEPLRREFGKSVTLYSDDFRDNYPTRGRRFQLDRYQLESPVVVWDDSHLRKITVLRTRGDKYGYDQQKCVMTIEGERLQQPRFLSVLGFRLIDTSWITEKLVLIKLDIGHAAGVYAIYDAEQDKLIYCESVHYGLVIEPDDAASRIKPIRSESNRTPAAGGSSHSP